MRDSVAAVAAGLRRLGVGRGDRVVAVIPNIPESVIALLACASLGAIWASCSPDFGTRGLIDRFAQISPKVLIAVDGYTYGGKPFDRREVVDALRAELPTLERTVLIPYLDPAATADGRDEMSWADLISGPEEPLAFESVPFDHPLWVLYSSGTTGLPKAIVHGHGGVVLEHSKAIGLMFDIRDGDRMFWFTTTGWMMWNFLVGSMLVGGVPVLYDGSPGYPNLDVLWDLAARARVSLFGTSAAFLGACQKAGIRPGETNDLSHLEAIGSTGSPLAVETFGWVYDAVKPDVWLASMSGGTDVVSAFVGGCPLLPVHAGELQARALGAKVEAFDEAGRSLVGRDRGAGADRAAAVDAGRLLERPRRDAAIARAISRCTRASGVTATGSASRSGGARSSRAGPTRPSTARASVSARASCTAWWKRFPRSLDSLVIGLELPGGGYRMPLFVVLADGVDLDDALKGRINGAIRAALSQRHVPDEIVAVTAVPRTLTGKKMEVPVKRLLQGRPLAEVAASGSTADPQALEWFEDYAARGGGSNR